MGSVTIARKTELDTRIAKARAEYDKLQEVTDDTKHWDGTIKHLVYWAQHEIDLVEEGERQEVLDLVASRQVDPR